MALGTPVTGSAAYSAASGSAVNAPYPSGIVAGDALVLMVGQKPTTANGGGVSTPTGWTLRASLTAAGGYGTTTGADVGNTNLYVYTKNTVTGTESGGLLVSLTDNNVAWAVVMRVPTSAGAISYGAATGSRTTAPTTGVAFDVATTDTASTTNFQAGDLALWAMCIPTDAITPSQFATQAITATGATFGTAVELGEPDSANGNDIGGYVAYAAVSSGSSTTAPTVTVTAASTTTNVRGPVIVLRIRETLTVLDGNSARQDTTSTSGAASQTHLASGNSARQDATSTSGAITVTADIALTGSSTRTDHAATSGAVGQTHLLVGNSAATNPTTSTDAVGQTHLMAGASARQDIAASAGAIVQAHQLAGESARQDTSATAGALTQQHQLAGASAAQATTATAGALDLTFTHVLAGNAAAQPTTSGAGAIVQDHRLAGASARGDASATGGAIVQDHALAGASVAQPTATTGGAMALPTAFAGADAAQPITSSTGALAQDHLLAGDFALQGATTTAGGITQSQALAGADVAQPATTTAGAIRQPGTTADRIAKILGNRQELDAASGYFRIYDNDGATVLYEARAWEDAAGTIPFRGQALMRIDRLVIP